MALSGSTPPSWWGLALVVVSAICALAVVVILFLGTSPGAAVMVSAAHLVIAAFAAYAATRLKDNSQHLASWKVIALKCTVLYAFLLFYNLRSANLASVCLVLCLIGNACMYSGAYRLYGAA